MSHPNETILKTVRDIIKNGNTLAGEKVFIDRMTHPMDECLPQVMLYTNAESITLLDQAPKRQKRNMTMMIEVIAQKPTEPDVSNQLKQLVWQIELLLADDDDWNETVNHQNISGLRFEFREDGRVPIGHCQMAYNVEYITVLPESIETQVVANLTPLDAIQGYDETVTPGDGNPQFGIDLTGDPGAPQPGDPDNKVEAELLIKTET